MGCDDVDYKSDAETLGFRDEVLNTDHLTGFRSGDLVAVGSRACPVFAAWYEPNVTHAGPEDPPDDGWLRDCFSETLVGPGSLGPDRCISFDAPGEISWDLVPAPCQLPPGADGFAPDRVRFTAIDLSEVAAHYDPTLDRFAVLALHPANPDGYPDDFGRALSGRVEVVAGGAVRLPIALNDARGTTVAWSDGTGRVDVVAGTPELAEVEDRATVAVRLGVGDEVHPALRLSGVELQPGSIVGVDPGAVASLEIVAAHWPRAAGGAASPVYARAIARDAQGSTLNGVPVDWAVTAGKLALVTADEDAHSFGSDYVGLEGTCAPFPRGQAERRTATLEARFGDYVATADLVWTVDPVHCGEFPDCDLDFEPDPECEGPAPALPSRTQCECRPSQPTPVGLLVFGLAVALTRRRRQ